MNTLLNALRQPFAERLGWSLVHLMWQGLFAGALVAAALWLLRRRSANARYLAAGGGLLLMPALFAATLLLQPEATRPGAAPPAAVAAARSPLADRVSCDDAETGAAFPGPAFNPQGDSGRSRAEQRTAVGGDPTVAADVHPAARDTLSSSSAVPDSVATLLTWRDRLAESISPALPLVVGVWIAGWLGLSLWHFCGWAALWRLRRRDASPIGGAIRETVNRLSERLGVRRPVAILKSARVGVPSLIGFLKPAVLLPGSVLTGLTPQQLEAVLAHELAHVRRHDYLANLLQTAIETLLFFHPVVWWLSRRIRVERENCCDDLAVAVTGDRLLYARSLTRLEELRHATAATATALTLAASGGSLLDRISRVLGVKRPRPPRRRLRAMGVTGLSGCLALAAGAWLLLAAIPADGTTAARSADAATSRPAERQSPAPLKLSLTISDRNWKSGDRIDFVVACKNVSTKPKRIPAWGFGKWSGLELADARGRAIALRGRQIGPRSSPRPEFLTLRPGATEHFLFSAQLHSGVLRGETLTGGRLAWQLPAGKLRVRAVFNTNKHVAAFKLWADERIWHGTAESDVVPVSVANVAPEKNPRTPIRVAVQTKDPKKTSYGWNEPIPVIIAKRNEGAKPLRFWHSGFWPNHKLSVKYADGSDVPRTELGNRCLDAFGPNTARDKNAPFQIGPKQNDTPFGPYDLRRDFKIAPGRVLHVRCDYLHDDTGEILHSNDLILTVKPQAQQPPRARLRKLDRESQTGWIDVGAADGVKPRMQYRVRGRQKGAKFPGRDHGLVEVVRIVGPRMAEVRILEQHLDRPIALGDVLLPVAPGDERRVIRVLKSPAGYGTLRDAYRKVRRGAPQKRDELRHAFSITAKHLRNLPATFAGLRNAGFQNTTNDDNWLLFRSKQLNDNDRQWISRIVRQGNTLTIDFTRAVWTGDYAENDTFNEILGVNLGKLPAGRYSVKWRFGHVRFRKFDRRGWPAVLETTIAKPREVSVDFTVVAKKQSAPKSAPATGTSADRRIYEDKARGFRIDIPRGWSATPAAYSVQHYRDVFLCINSNGDKALRVTNTRRGNTSTYGPAGVAAQLKPGTAYIDFAIFDGPGGGANFAGKPDSVAGDLEPLLKTFKPTPAAGGKLSLATLSFVKGGHRWHACVYFREPVQPEVKKQALALLRSFRFSDAKPNSRRSRFRDRQRFARALKKINTSMTERQVRGILGKPDDIRTDGEGEGISTTGTRAIWRYGTSGHLTTATLGRVFFDRQGQVQYIVGKGTPPPAGMFTESQLRDLLRVLDAVPSYDSALRFNPRLLIRAVNTLQPLGKRKVLAAIGEYHRISSDLANTAGRKGLFLVLRTLFEIPPEQGHMPLMHVGASLPPAPPNKRLLPRFPIVIAGDVPFLVTTGYLLGGRAQPVEQHIAYFHRHGKIRTKPLAPSAEPFAELARIEKAASWPYRSRQPGDRLHHQLLEQATRLLDTAHDFKPRGQGGFYLPYSRKNTAARDNIVAAAAHQSSLGRRNAPVRESRRVIAALRAVRGAAYSRAKFSSSFSPAC